MKILIILLSFYVGVSVLFVLVQLGFIIIMGDEIDQSSKPTFLEMLKNAFSWPIVVLRK